VTDTLKSICEQSTHLNNPRLDFIPAELDRCREILVRDLGELVSAATAENEKSVVLLAGTILEGILYTLVKLEADYIAERKGTFEFDPTHSLQNYIEIFNRWLRDLMPTVILPDSITSYRNLVHMNRELNSPPGVCAAASREMLRTLDSLLGAIAELTRP
jgi:hypothetical protein